MSPAAAVTAEHLISLIVLAWGTAWAARRVGASRRSAATVALAFSLGPMITSLNVEQNMFAALSWTGFILVAALELPRLGARAIAGLAVPLALSWLAGAPEITLCQVGLATVSACMAVPRARRLTATGLTGLGIGGSLLLAAPVTFPAFELSRRLPALTRHEALGWSASPIDLLSIAWPAVNSPAKDFFTDQLLVPLLLIGIFLPVAALFGFWRGGRLDRALGILVLGLLGLSLGRYCAPSAWFLTHLPVVRSFRFPVKYVIPAEWLMCLLAARGLDRLTAMGRRLRRIGVVAGMGTAVLLLVAGAGIYALPHLRSDAGPGLKVALIWLAAAFFVGLAITFPGSPLARGRRLGRTLGGFLVLEAISHAVSPDTASRAEIAVDRMLVDRMHAEGWGRTTVGEPLETSDFGSPLAGSLFPPPCLPFLRNRFAESTLSSIYADGPLDDTRMGDLWDQVSDQRPFRDLVGVKWVVTVPPAPQLDLTAIASCDGAPSNHQLRVYRSETAMPRAFLVHQTQPFEGDADAALWLNDREEPFRTTALLAKPPVLSGCTGAESTRVTTDRPGALDVEVTACGSSLLVLNEAADSGWSGTLDGAPTPLLTTDVYLQAVVVPAGVHHVILRYAPAAFRWGLATALATALALVAAGRARHLPRLFRGAAE